MRSLTVATAADRRQGQVVRIYRILVGVDGSPSSLYALEWGSSLATSFGAETIVLHATDSVAPSHLTALERAMDTWTWRLRSEARPHRTMLADGPPAKVLFHTAVNESAELIVVGGRGLGNVSKTPTEVEGDTVGELLKISDRPVLVVNDLGTPRR